MSQKIPRERLELVERLYLAGQSETAIQRAVSLKYGITRRAVRKYLQRVRAKLAETTKAVTPEDARARVEGMLLGAYERSLSGPKPDAKAAVQAAARLGELYGVMGARKLELTGAGGAPIRHEHDVSPESLFDRIAALAAGPPGEPRPGDAPQGDREDDPGGAPGPLG